MSRPTTPSPEVAGPTHGSFPAGPTLRAVLFDMDGTLVETEQHWGQALAELAERLGGRLSAEARARTIGTSIAVSIAVLHADLALTRTEAQAGADAAWVTDRTAELLGGGVEWRPGARELLRVVGAAGLRTALVTTTPRRLAEIVLGSMCGDLGGDPFDVTICGDEVPARKPDPAPYRQAMAALGVEPRECVVIEDSLPGITAGLAAGAAVLGVPAEQGIPAAGGLTLRASLVGVRLPELDDVLAASGPAASGPTVSGPAVSGPAASGPTVSGLTAFVLADAPA